MKKHKLQATNECVDKISGDICELKKSLQFTQDQLGEELRNIKKEIEKLDGNIKCMENEFLDSDEVSSKLLELEDRCCHNNL